MGAKIVYNHKAIEKKWHDKWQENPVNPRFRDNGEKKEKILLSGYVPVSVRKRSACRALERICDL